jgi:hypothetical protein
LLVSPGFDSRRPLVAAPLADLNRRYTLAGERGDGAELLAIGRALYAWLDGEEGWLAALRQNLSQPFVLEIRGPLAPNSDEPKSGG